MDWCVRVSQKLEYACRAMAQLAKQADGKTITRLDEIAQREAVSSNFLVQILNDLRRSGLITSKRGKFGGYLLTGKAEDISLYDIVQSVEPTLLENTTSSEGQSGASVSKVWHSASNHFASQLKETKLSSMAESDAGPMFYI
ncbi:RrF2 family transcriptional regulator [Rubritalea tangerina]|uniref:RrF2 family transcriptional regulator n=1 Tax=Rubritalea tangerina TaxID=430798 RepID=A0ABW4ZFQ8_9BACT